MTEDGSIPPAPAPHPGFRPCVGIVLLNADDRIFAGRRADSAGPEWQMPQGGIDPGETPLEAARRELREETGVAGIEFIGEFPAWLAYELPEARRPAYWEGRFRGQTQKWLVFRLQQPEDAIVIDGSHAEFRSWSWKSPEALAAECVPFKRPLYEQVVAWLRQILA